MNEHAKLRRALTASSLRVNPEKLPERAVLDVFGLLRRVFTYARPYAGKRNWLVAMVLLRACLLPAAAWAIGEIINGPISAANPLGIAWATAGHSGYRTCWTT